MSNKILYIYPSLSSFVKSDLAILRTKYIIIENTYDWNKKYYTPVYLFHQFLFLIIHINKLRAIFISSGGYWSVLPTLFGKITKTKVYIILNGSDCAAIHALNYGSLRKPILKLACKYSYKMASKLLPVSSSLIKTKNTYYSDDKFSFQGYKHFFPKINTENKVVPNGCDSNFWIRDTNEKKEENTFIAVLSNEQFFLKGGDVIINIAKFFPKQKFYIAGCDTPKIEKTDNVHFLGKVSPEKLRELYSKCQFHFQLSVFEGFGCALAEAMLCECIPIGSSVNIIPEIIGETGFILEKRDVVDLEETVRKALAVEDKKALGQKARTRIIDKYPIDKRERELFSLIDG